ncbi:ABC transporter substrate-binding protein [Arthrobacter zhangbolii]|uniref:ABC transporter substrate-binding protein n=1 Tax=Arthrobacter zhangbolii TaxID=2886936 RepID=A0A9X1MAK6_9MICC|nr:ABC transporter substrate-binding protein [Arthrobacter zhangbolii]MCC3274051.1 ABC transporter substrate-binding protein [Arthrobacter zhangbolii]MCC3295111.1 ABC transporter substrate-binding protein [Arthrobacter zhangbolii]UON92845.1 ABC transporter substrate-binding protein [Arthrobacter zhangbolii]
MRTTPRALRLPLLAGAAALALALSACGGGSEGAAGEAPAADALEQAEGVTEVNFWHSMDGTNGETLDKLIAEFNAANEGKVEVKSVYQGDYDTTITKYKAAVQSNSTPSMVQIYDIGTQFMIDSGAVLPTQAFIDRDEYDVSDLQPNIAGYYTIDDELWSMPFNTSMPVLYYNKTLFEAAGLDPETAPATLDEVGDAANKLSKVNGGPAEFGFNAAIYGWLLEQEIAANGELYCGPDNGRSGERAGEYTFNNDTAVQFVDWWKELVDTGVAGNTGRVTADAQNAFKSGTIGITLESTGALGGMQKAADEQGFELGVGFYPKIEQNDSGPIIGGASLWVSDEGHSEAEKQASWEFMQFLAQPESQATWHTGTGYFPISKAALDEPKDVEWREQHPQFNVAVDQLEATELTSATQGCSAGTMPQAREAAENALEGALLGGDSKSELTDSVTELKVEVENYNNSVK